MRLSARRFKNRESQRAFSAQQNAAWVRKLAKLPLLSSVSICTHLSVAQIMDGPCSVLCASITIKRPGKEAARRLVKRQTKAEQLIKSRRPRELISQ
jgi:hypothetical protein